MVIAMVVAVIIAACIVSVIIAAMIVAVVVLPAVRIHGPTVLTTAVTAAAAAGTMAGPAIRIIVLAEAGFRNGEGEQARQHHAPVHEFNGHINSPFRERGWGA
jgi:hypothetical protein